MPGIDAAPRTSFVGLAAWLRDAEATRACDVLGGPEFPFAFDVGAVRGLVCRSA